MSESYRVERNLKETASYLFYVSHQFKDGKGTMSGAHIHNDIELIYATSGSFAVFLNGKRHYFLSGDLLVINSHEVHKIDTLSDGLNSYIVLKFSPELIYSAEQSIFEIKYILPFILDSATHQKIISAPFLEGSCIKEAMYELVEENNNRDYGFEIAIKMDICRIFLWILRFWHKNGVNLNIDSSSLENYNSRMSKVFSYISENYSQNITVAQMAELCFMSYSYFSKIFKKITGKSFNDYVNYIRLREAERLLATTEMAVTEIAYSTGFSSSSYFVSKFREHKNMTPKKYRASISQHNAQ